MLDLDYILENTKWVIRYTSGYRLVVNGKDRFKYYGLDEVKDIDTVYWENQPKELQEFWKDYSYAVYTLKRHDLYSVKDFYAEWSKDPNQFKPERRPVISKLREEFDKLRSLAEQKDLNIIVSNYDKRCMGNHYFNNWITALNQMDEDFDVVEVEQVGNDIYITVQCDDFELCQRLDYLSNKAALDSAFN